MDADELWLALSEAIHLVEEYAQYVSPFLLQKWGHEEDLARLRGVLDR